MLSHVDNPLKPSGASQSNRYKLLRLLGKNSGRRTWLAWDLQCQTLVVLKCLIFDRDFTWEALKLFQREAALLKFLSHPAIPCYLDFFKQESPGEIRFTFVQNYIEGKSLADVLKAGHSFTEAEIKQLVAALLEILIYLHQQKPPIIHRDIKPNNIILTHRSDGRIGQVYLVDFGSVQTLMTQEGCTFTVVGTYGYMPPEQFGGQAIPASDLYGVGTTAIALASRQHPADLPQRNLRIQFEQSVCLSPAFKRWLQWMTEPDSARRPPSAQFALHALKHPGMVQQQRLLQRKQTQRPGTFQVLKNAVSQSTGKGMVMGAVFGGLFGTGIFPYIGTTLGAWIGGAAGLCLGFLNGGWLAYLTIRFFPTLKHPHQYQWAMQLASSFFFGGGICLIIIVWFVGSQAPISALSIFLAIVGVLIALIAALSGRLIGQDFAQWYGSKIEEQDRQHGKEQTMD